MLGRLRVTHTGPCRPRLTVVRQGVRARVAACTRATLPLLHHYPRRAPSLASCCVCRRGCVLRGAHWSHFPLLGRARVLRLGVRERGRGVGLSRHTWHTHITDTRRPSPFLLAPHFSLVWGFWGWYVPLPRQCVVLATLFLSPPLPPPTSDPSGTNGGDLNLRAGSGQTQGGSVNLLAGTGSTQTGGTINIVSGPGSGASSGPIVIRTGNAGTTGVSGDLILSTVRSVCLERERGSVRGKSVCRGRVM